MRDVTEEVQQGNAMEPGSFTIEAIDVAARLGVSRTRLSQITSRGDLSFSRRKVGTRMRIFYNAEEVEAYVRARDEAAQFRSSGSQALLARGQPWPHSAVVSQPPRQGAHSFSPYSPFTCDQRRDMSPVMRAPENDAESVRHSALGSDVADRLCRIERSVEALSASLARIPARTPPRASDQTEQRRSRDQLVKLERQMQALEARLETLQELFLSVQQQMASQTRQILTRMASSQRALATGPENRRPLQSSLFEARHAAGSEDQGKRPRSQPCRKKRARVQNTKGSLRRRCI